MITLTENNLEAGAGGNGTKGYQPYLRLHTNSGTYTYRADGVRLNDLQEAIQTAEQWKAECIEAGRILT